MWGEIVDLFSAVVLGVKSFTFGTKSKIQQREKPTKPLARLVYVTQGKEISLKNKPAVILHDFSV